MCEKSLFDLHEDDTHDTPWARTVGYEKEERPMQAVNKIVVRGSVEVVFFRSSRPQLIVASDQKHGAREIKTKFRGNKLIIENEGVQISRSAGGIHVSGSGNIVAGGNIYVSGGRVINQQIGSTNGADVVVGISLPEAPGIRVEGSGDISLYGIDQSVLDLAVQGSGDIVAFGQVDGLNADVAGSGDIDASELMADTASLMIAGSGDIDAHATKSVRARVAGSGDIVIRGNPQERDHSVAGSGKIKFKK